MQFLKQITLLAMFLLAFGVIAASAQVTVTGSTGADGPYTSLGAAFTAINAGTHTGNNITVAISANTIESAPAVLNSGAWTSLTINPTADGVTVAGATATGRGVIELNGADNVTINGDNPNTAGINRNLTVSNTAVATVIANSVIRIATSAAVTSADNDTIKNLILLGNVTGGNASTIISTSGSSNSSFGIYAGGNGGAAANTDPTAITSVTANTALSGTTITIL